MKIAQVVTYVSENGAFGGPVAVAVGQAIELASRGHEVELLAGWDGLVSLTVPGVTVRLFPVKRALPGGFSGLIAPALQRFMHKHGSEFDVIHVHLARDLISLPVALCANRKRQRLVVQTHGMVMPDKRTKSRVLDALLMRTVLSRADAVLTLTAMETVGISRITTGRSRILRVTNGIDVSAVPSRKQLAASSPPQVVFLARLHPRKRVLAFAEMALNLIRGGSTATFHVVGPDEGDLEELLEFIDLERLTTRLTYEGSISAGMAPIRLAAASIYVLPSYGEIVPMSVLEAISAGTPVVITDDCGLANELNRRDAAIVTDGSVAQLTAAVEKLLGHPELRQAMATNASIALKEVFSVQSVVDDLEAVYRTGP